MTAAAPQPGGDDRASHHARHGLLVPLAHRLSGYTTLHYELTA